jgi:para-nitrobenzyl esterase
MFRWMVVLLALTAASIPASSQTVRVEGGDVSGMATKTPRVLVYKGIPYAAPPVGNLRWHAPEPVAAWQGVRKADRLPPMCMQNQSDPKGVFYWGQLPASEDCLYLNVWTPAKSANDRLPVMVWIHGGAFRVGWGGSKFIDGEGLAAQGVLLVTINYRLDVFGFLAHPALSQESEHHVSGNYGTLDQIAALHWVQKNIAAFGGDPKQVTLFGQSAGAASVCDLMASPLAKALFIRAAGESMGCFGGMPKLASAEQAGARFAAAANAASLTELRAKPAEELLKVKGEFPFRPVVDDYVWPKDTSAIFRDGEQNSVPVLVGSNSDEGTVLGVPPESAADFVQMATRQYKDEVDDFLKLFPANTNAEAISSFYAFQRDAMASQERMWARAVARSGKPAYRYYFSHSSPIPDGMYTEQARNPLGAFHTAEIVYVFCNLDARPWSWTHTERKLSQTMSAYWVNFAKKGNPNGPGLPKWPAADATNDVLLEFGQSAKPMVRQGLDERQLDFFKEFETKRLRAN